MDSNMLNKEAAINSFIEVKKIHLDILIWEGRNAERGCYHAWSNITYYVNDKTFATVKIFVNDSLVHKYGPKKQETILFDCGGGEYEKRLSHIDDCKQYLIEVGFVDSRLRGDKYIGLDDFCKIKKISFSSNINKVRLKRDLD